MRENAAITDSRATEADKQLPRLEANDALQHRVDDQGRKQHRQRADRRRDVSASQLVKIQQTALRGMEKTSSRKPAIKTDQTSRIVCLQSRARVCVLTSA